MGNPTTRVLAILEILQTCGLMTAAELSRRLQIDPRSVRRYIVALEALGIPIVAERGRDGGYRLMHGFKIPPMMFTNDEAVALVLGLTATRHLGMSDADPAAEGALAKLERVLPEPLRLRVRAIRDVVDVGMPPASSRGKPETLAILSMAAQARQRVDLGYRNASGVETRRCLDPYGLAYNEGNWYVVGYCHLRCERRSFRLDRIAHVVPLPRYFGRPAGFDVLTYVSNAVATLPRAYSVQVLLKTDLPSACAAIGTGVGVLEIDEAGVMLRSEVDSLDWMAKELARLPFRFTIQEPPALRAALAKHATALLDSLA